MKDEGLRIDQGWNGLAGQKSDKRKDISGSSSIGQDQVALQDVLRHPMGACPSQNRIRAGLAWAPIDHAEHVWLALPILCIAQPHLTADIVISGICRP